MRRVRLKGRVRSELGTQAARRLRRQGLIPGVIYGREVEPIHIVFEKRDILPLLKEGVRFLSVEIGERTYDTVLQDVQYDYLNDRILHIDLHHVLLTERVKMTVPVVIKGEPKPGPGVGIVEQHIEELEIECAASEAPDKIEVDISQLDLGESLHVGDLRLSDNINILTPENVTIVSVLAPHEEEEEETEEEEREPEEVKKPKKREEIGEE